MVCGLFSERIFFLLTVLQHRSKAKQSNAPLPSEKLRPSSDFLLPLVANFTSSICSIPPPLSSGHSSLRYATRSALSLDLKIRSISFPQAKSPRYTLKYSWIFRVAVYAAGMYGVHGWLDSALCATGEREWSVSEQNQEGEFRGRVAQ